MVCPRIHEYGDLAHGYLIPGLAAQEMDVNHKGFGELRLTFPGIHNKSELCKCYILHKLIAS